MKSFALVSVKLSPNRSSLFCVFTSLHLLRHRNIKRKKNNQQGKNSERKKESVNFWFSIYLSVADVSEYLPQLHNFNTQTISKIYMRNKKKIEWKQIEYFSWNWKMYAYWHNKVGMMCMILLFRVFFFSLALQSVVVFSVSSHFIYIIWVAVWHTKFMYFQLVNQINIQNCSDIFKAFGTLLQCFLYVLFIDTLTLVLFLCVQHQTFPTN